jgi:hypothetical protein
MTNLEPEPLHDVPLRQWLRLAWVNYWRVLGPMLLFSFIVFLIEVVESPRLILLPYALPQFASGCLHMLLAAGPVAICLAQLKGEPWSFGMFFRGFHRQRSWPLISYLVGMFLIMGVILLVLFVPVAILFWLLQMFLWVVARPIHGDHVFVFGTIYAVACSVAAAMFGWVRLRFFALPLILDGRLSVDEAFRTSWKLSRSQWGLLLKAALVLGSFHVIVFLPGLLVGMSSELFRADLSHVGDSHALADRIAGVGVFLLFLGLVAQPFIYPFTALAVNAGYLLMTGQKPVDAGCQVEPQRVSMGGDIVAPHVH